MSEEEGIHLSVNFDPSQFIVPISSVDVCPEDFLYSQAISFVSIISQAERHASINWITLMQGRMPEDVLNRAALGRWNPWALLKHQGVVS